jgi:hypothetical protein
MADRKYFSILICDHPEHGVVNVFANGLPLDVVRDGKFVADELFDARNPCRTIDDLYGYLRTVIEKIYDMETK